MLRMINGEAAEELAEVNVEASRDGTGGQEKQNMKKGPWTAAEDAILIEYVKKYGEGNWNSVQRNSGLSRCGKSCRLRWANHLRPNLKKGAFSQEEEQIIIELHAKLGNKWARMASQLPGRTDNEIKNFWNTRMKRRQRAGLPLYPPEVQDEAAVYHLHQHHQYFPVAPPTHSSPSFSFSSLLSSSTYPQNLHQQPNYSDSAHDSTNQFQYQQTTGVPLVSCVSPDGFNYGFDYSNGVTLGLNTEISSSQSETPASSYSTGGVHGLMGGSSINNNNNNNNNNASIDYYEVAPLSSSPEGNSGLLDALVVEAQALSRTDNKSKTTKSEDSTAGKRLSLKRKTMTEDREDVNNNGVTHRDDLSSSQLSTGIGKKTACYRDALEEMNSMDDDLFSLLNNFPSEMPVPEWYRKGERQSVEVENKKDASQPNTDQQLAWTLGTCWNNMPTICQIPI